MTVGFEATANTGTGSGTLRLELPGDAGDAVSAALALAAHEPAIAALEDWLQQPLDPQPLLPSGTTPPLLWADADGLRLGMPWALLRAQTSAPAWPWRWPELLFRVELASFEAAPLPPDAGEGLLLLPAAFEPPWRTRLHDEHHGLVAEAEWQGPGSELLLSTAPEPATAERSPWRVELIEACRRPLPELLGWQPASQAWRPGADAALKRADGGQHAGRIAPALQAFGLWLAA